MSFISGTTGTPNDEVSWNGNGWCVGSHNGGIMKIVTAYKCEAKGEYIQFAGDGATMWSPLGDFEILSLDE